MNLFYIYSCCVILKLSFEAKFKKFGEFLFCWTEKIIMGIIYKSIYIYNRYLKHRCP